jgi:thiol-disulfide isomerase/thioredoxin
MIAGKRFLPRIETAIAAPDTSAEAVNSSIYTDVLLYEAINEITFSGPGGSMNRTTFSGLFNFVSKNYHGVLRDKLILLTFLNYAGKDPESTNYLGKAFAEMDNDTSKNLLREWAANHLSGAPAYSFDLTDENGRRFTLKDFHGKLIVADFWFYGCGGCAEMPAAMTNVYKKYGQNPKVVFLSINVDTKKATWQSGLKTGQYTIPGSIHLSLLALSRNDPFITYYGYDSYPQLLLIGVNGEIISAYAPDPRADDGKKLIDLIGSHID